MTSLEKLYGLRGLIHKKYRSISEFARDIGWTQNKMSRMMNAKYIPSIPEARMMADKLEVPIGDIVYFFA